jgi:hypothetical protein
VTVTRTRLGSVLLVVGATVTLAACSSGSAGPAVTVTETTTVTATPGDSVTSSEAPSDTPTSEASSASDGGGTQSAPLAFGQRDSVGSWSATVVSVDKNATAKVLAANSFNDKPKSGQTYILVKVSATYTGADQGDPSFALGASFLGSDKRLYSDSDASCVEPSPLSDEPKVTTGGNVSGNLCLLVPKTVVAAGGLIEVKDRMAFDDSAAAWWQVP